MAACTSVLDRAKAILLKPAETWGVIKNESTSIKDIYQKYLVILAAVPAIATFIGLTVVGISIPFLGTWKPPMFPTLVSQIVHYVISLGMVYVAALVIEKLGPKFEARVDTLSAFKLVAYSMTPAWVAGIFGVFPSLMMLMGLVGFAYSVYVFMLGVQPLTGVPDNRKIGYVVVSALVIVVLGIIINFIAGNFSPTPNMAPVVSGDRGLPADQMKQIEDSMKALQNMLPKPN
jgi:hypothetical protein